MRFYPLTGNDDAMQGIITEPKHILDELITSRENGTLIGIWAPSLGAGLNLCAVENIFDDDEEHDKVIILKENDHHGVPLHAHVLFLQEIEKVFPMKTLYADNVQNHAGIVR
jgi:hypothetical protein